MKSNIYGISNPDFESSLITIECVLGKGLPLTIIVGLAGRSVTESRDRVRAAFHASGITYPRRKLTINLSPADVPKHGAVFDLAIAVSILAAAGLIPSSHTPAAYIGELGLDGSLRPVRGIIGQLVSGYRAGIRRFFIPAANFEQASIVPGIELMPIATLKELYDYLNGFVSIGGACALKQTPISAPANPFTGISGQATAKRSVCIAAAGGHNILLEGPPGCGKTLLAKALAKALPPMSVAESLIATHTHSLVQSDYQSIVTVRPLVVPHYTISPGKLIGAGRTIGAIQLAQTGVLLLDEFPEFNRHTLEALRQPLDAAIANPEQHFQLAATANPCPCGHLGSSTKLTCSCTPYNIKRYREKLSGPLSDRIDVFIYLEPLSSNKLFQPITHRDNTPSKSIARARKHQLTRYGSGITNATCPDELLKNTALLSPDAKELLINAGSHLGLSARGHIRSLRVARTIADLEDSKTITAAHVAEAVQFRQRREVAA